jgi:hypothetical protein
MAKAKTLKATIAEAVEIKDFVSYWQARSYVEGIEALLPPFRELIREDKAVEAIALIEHTMRLMEKNWSKVDDSDGGLSEVFKNLQKLHLEACVEAKPDPVHLAKYLFEWAMATDYDAFHDVPKDYAGVLGSKGMAVLGRLIDEDLVKVPISMPGDDSWDTSLFRIKAWAEMYARVTKDFDKLLTVLTRDVSSPYRFLEIAQACKEFGRHDLAESWAVKGMAAFPRAKADSRLRTFLAGEYVVKGRIDDAYKLLWENFEDCQHQYLDAYRELKDLGEKVGRWGEWQSRTMELLRSRSAAVGVLIFEGRLKEAYAEARSKGCTEHGWKELAEALSKGEPELAYRALGTLFTTLMKNYGNAVTRRNLAWTVKSMVRVAKNAGLTKEFKAWLEEQKVLNKRRTGFLNDLKSMKL